MLELGRLLRLSLLPSALADVCVGVVVGAGGKWPEGSAPFALVLSSLGIYHGAMALNDWADREEDAIARPERPVPSGRISPTGALTLAAVLIGAGIGAAFLAGVRPGLWMTVVATLAVAYDLRGRGPILGPVLLGACRFGNLGAGLMLATWMSGETPDALGLLPAVWYGVYVFVVSCLGRLEDREDPRPLGRRPSRYLIIASTLLFALPLLGLRYDAGAWGYIGCAIVSGGAAFGLAKEAHRAEWSRGLVGRAMGLCLRRLIAFTAALALLFAGTGTAPLVVAAIALAGYPASFALRRVFPPS